MPLESSPKHYAIIGAGMLGLTLAMRLRQAGHQVTLFESSESIGGQAGVWQLGDITWDRHYHVIAQDDTYLLDFLDELGLTSELVWSTTRTGFFARGRLYSLTTRWDFVRFPLISPLGKARLVATLLKAASLRDLSPYEQESSLSWLTRWSGAKVTRVLWTPLLKSKFGEHYGNLSAAFIIRTIQRMFGARRGERKEELFGYVRGGYATILNRLEQHLAELGITVRLNAIVKNVVSQESGVEIETLVSKFHFDHAVITAAAPIVPLLCHEMSPAQRDAYRTRPYLGIVCASLLLEEPLSDFYITNITDSGIPFTGVIEMSALVDREEFQGRSLVYLPRYVAPDDVLMNLDDDVIREHYLTQLETMYPHFNRSHVLAFKVSRVRYVMAVPLAGPAAPPPVATGLPHISSVNTSHITDGVLTVNRIIALAESTLPQVL